MILIKEKINEPVFKMKVGVFYHRGPDDCGILVEKMWVLVSGGLALLIYLTPGINL